jgi:Na+/H+ antiporter NhaD/arsenite permease-like protein
MTLITAIIAGLGCGYFLGLRPKALAVFLAVWLVVLIFQTFIALDAEDVPPEAWEYVPVQVVIFLVGMVMIWGGTKIRARSSRP